MLKKGGLVSLLEIRLLGIEGDRFANVQIAAPLTRAGFYIIALLLLCS